MWQEIFAAVRHGKLTQTEAWRMPVDIRRWWLGEAAKEAERNQGNAPPGKDEAVRASKTPWQGK